ncbi:MAG: hypothetical protein HQM08_15560 [Candidatus Riflebacteria bacterium]|nr:hypothetical protein [Candidatus Riflebacteria bacterium]
MKSSKTDSLGFPSKKMEGDVEALQNQPGDSGEIDLVLGHLKAKRWKKALIILEKVISESYPEARTFFLAGLAYIEINDLEKGIKALNEAIRLKPDHTGAHAALSSIHLQRGDIEAAMESYKKLKLLEPVQTKETEPPPTDEEETTGKEKPVSLTIH